MGDLLFFFAALVAIYLTPGPDMVLVLGTTVSEGPRQAIATSVGLAVARSTHVFLAAAGLATLFESQPWTYHTVRLLGAVYLLYLGWQFLKKNTVLPEQDVLAGMAAAKPGLLAAFRRGLVTNFLNPKSLIFCSVLLPQFIYPELSGVAGQFAVLALMLVLTGFAFDLAYALLGRGLWAITAENAKYQKAQNNVFALLMLGIGMKVAFS